MAEAEAVQAELMSPPGERPEEHLCDHPALQRPSNQSTRREREREKREREEGGREKREGERERGREKREGGRRGDGDQV
jgi:hypothetical protein